MSSEFYAKMFGNKERTCQEFAIQQTTTRSTCHERRTPDRFACLFEERTAVLFGKDSYCKGQHVPYTDYLHRRSAVWVRVSEDEAR